MRLLPISHPRPGSRRFKGPGTGIRKSAARHVESVKDGSPGWSSTDLGTSEHMYSEGGGGVYYQL
jgi:hypothetical protein